MARHFKRPYPLPHRSRKAIVEYVMGHQLYHPVNYNNGGVVLAWNIKVRRWDFESGHHPGGEKNEPRFDAAWKAHLETREGQDTFAQACEMGLFQYMEGGWTPWPGGEDGYKFTTNGRSGGYLILTDWPGPAPRFWRTYPMVWDDRSGLRSWLEESLSIADLRKLYGVMACLDYETRPEAISDAMAYGYAWIRHLWEEDLLEDESEGIRKLEASRPDLYGHETAP